MIKLSQTEDFILFIINGSGKKILTTHGSQSETSDSYCWRSILNYFIIQLSNKLSEQPPKIMAPLDNKPLQKK